MVVIQRQRKFPTRFLLPAFISVVVVCLLTIIPLRNAEKEQLRKQANGSSKPVQVMFVSQDNQGLDTSPSACVYASFSDLSHDELDPRKGERHMVDPPKGGSQTLVCCQTTVGPWSIVVHDKWAPIGAARFLKMVSVGYFSTQVPLMRCLKNFICQFGLAGDPQVNKQYRSSMQDDPNWLPEGPTHRENENGIKRFSKGYLAYAGAGSNSRGNQFIVSLENVGPLAGGSPWEVPWGELVGQHSFETLSKIYTGYGEKGPSQGLIGRTGVTEDVRKDFPKMDYITSCEIVDKRMMED
mmetsp:Transcript_28307/g.41820  ORF Transcript_28307/g.41820 Transcript_28307/m.41820 type:complete len:296 (-) Transcript_28307:800-1687(-)